MYKINLEKEITVEEVINSVECVMLDHVVNYQEEEHEVRVKGKVLFTLKLDVKDSSKLLNDEIDVNFTIPYKDISNGQSLTFNIDNYQVNTSENNIKIVLFCVINGVEKISKDFEVENAFNELLNYRNKNNEVITNISLKDEIQIPFTKDVDVISTTETNEQIKEDYQEPIKVESNTNNEAINNVMQNNKKDEIFSVEKFTIFSLFYRANSGDTYQSISNAFNLDVSLLREINNDKEIYEGSLIKLPHERRH